jgi:hypothetical protein
MVGGTGSQPSTHGAKFPRNLLAFSTHVSENGHFRKHGCAQPWLMLPIGGTELPTKGAKIGEMMLPAVGSGMRAAFDASASEPDYSLMLLNRYEWTLLERLKDSCCACAWPSAVSFQLSALEVKVGSSGTLTHRQPAWRVLPTVLSPSVFLQRYLETLLPH